MLRIGTPFIENTGSGVRLCARIGLPEGERTAWFAVEPEWAEYLSSDRADAFIAAFLPRAMALGEDMVCDGPATPRFLYQLNHYLIPALAANTKRYRAMSVSAPPAPAPERVPFAVGTGWTGGADSLYTLMRHTGDIEPGYKLTHLMVAGVGTFEGPDEAEDYDTLLARARKAAGRFGLKAVGVYSNIQHLLDEKYLSVAAYRLPAAVLALGGLFRVFLNSSAYEFPTFAFAEENSAYYELLSLACFETDSTVFYSSGGDATRMRKLRELSAFPPAWDTLHPCVKLGEKNCGRCGKCVRTETALYALGTLERFAQVFDVEEFYKNRDWYLAQTVLKRRSQHYAESLRLLEERGEKLPPRVLRGARIMEAAAKAAQAHEKDLLPREE